MFEIDVSVFYLFVEFFNVTFHSIEFPYQFSELGIDSHQIHLFFCQNHNGLVIYPFILLCLLNPASEHIHLCCAIV